MCTLGTVTVWDPSTDTDSSEVPVAMIVNSSELRNAGFDLREVIPVQLEVVTRGARRTRGTTLKQIHGMGTRSARRYVLSVDNDNEFRSRCERIRVGRFGSSTCMFHHNNRGKID